MITPDELQAWREACEKAVDGPWAFHHCDLRTPEGYRVLMISGYEAAADMEFIALSRTALPRAIAEIEALRTELGHLRKHVAHNDEEYATMKAVLREEHRACMQMRPVLDAAKKWAKRGRVDADEEHELLAAIDAAIAEQEGK